MFKTLKSNSWGQPRSQGLLRFKDGGWARRRPWDTLAKYSMNRGVFITWHTIETRFLYTWPTVLGSNIIFEPKSVAKTSFDSVSRDKILHDSWSILQACTRVFSAPSRHLESRVDPGNEVDRLSWWISTSTRARMFLFCCLLIDTVTLIFCRYLETEHIRYCYSGATGMAKLPLRSVYADGSRDPSKPTTGRLPNGDVINGTNSYKMLLPFFTSSSITPEELRSMGYKKLKALLGQVKMYTSLCN